MTAIMRSDQLAFSTNAFKQSTLPEAVRAIAKQGYAGVEVMADAPHMRADTFTDAQAKDIRALIDDLGLAVSNVNAFTGFCFDGGDTYHPTWVEPDAALRQQRIDYTRRAIELTAMIGGRTISLQPGGPYMGRNVDELFDLYAEGLRQCLAVARSCGVTLGVEPEPGLMIENTKQFDRLKRHGFPDEPQVMMNCDVGHFFCVWQDPAEVIRSHHDVIAHVHLEDIKGKRVHQHYVPGDGKINFPAIFAALDEVGYNGFVTVELYPYTSTATEVARRAVEHLRPLLT